MATETVIPESPLKENVPSMEFNKKMKNSVSAVPILKEMNEREKIPVSLKGKGPLSDEEIPLKDFYKRTKMSNISSSKEQKKKKIPRKRRVASFRSEKKPIPVSDDLSYSDFIKYSGSESEEEVLRDGDREEELEGYKYVLNENINTYTRVKTPVKVYYKRRGCSVLHCKTYPVPTVTKLALHRYNTIEGTDYEYLGLVKAYRMQVNGSHYTVRFKARLPSKLPIYFQAMIWQRIPNEKDEVLVDVDYIYPLPK